MTISTFLSSKYGKLWGLFPKDPFFGHQVAKILPPKKKKKKSLILTPALFHKK
jgi:hypothetical protein